MDSFEFTSPVGAFTPNEYGVFDLGGNVWEWCQDAFNQSSCLGVLPGGSWNTSLQQCMLASRREALPFELQHAKVEFASCWSLAVMASGPQGRRGTSKGGRSKTTKPVSASILK